jgi:hypothetical protein
MKAEIIIQAVLTKMWVRAGHLQYLLDSILERWQDTFYIKKITVFKQLTYMAQAGARLLCGLVSPSQVPERA